jgi:hypothetical protein
VVGKAQTTKVNFWAGAKKRDYIKHPESLREIIVISMYISVTLTTITSTKKKRTTKDTSTIQFHGGAVFWVMELCNVTSGYQELEEHIAAIFRAEIKM